jgi:hypothetical protein
VSKIWNRGNLVDLFSLIFLHKGGQ